MKQSPTIDTRFFLTHFLADPGPTREKTRRKIEEFEAQKALVPTIVLHEVYKFEYDTLGVDVATLRVDSIVRSNFRVVDLDTTIAVSAARLRCRYRRLPTADSIIAATAIEHKSRTVVSDDLHFREIEGVNVEWI